jgi:hypothetical protein
MKKYIYYSFAIVFLILNSNYIYSQSKITEIKKGDSLFPTIIVKGYASQKMWLGCTINPDTYSEVDLKPKKVKKGYFEIEFNMSAGLTAGLFERTKKGSSSIPYVVALWEDRINLRKCEKKYGKGADQCKWARKNGHQMEGRIDRRVGKLNP